MIDVSDRSDVDVRFGSLKLLFCHCSLLCCVCSVRLCLRVFAASIRPGTFIEPVPWAKTAKFLLLLAASSYYAILHAFIMEPMIRIELMTSSLPRTRSTN